MSIEVTCNCGKSLKAPDAAAGKKGRCPGCGAVLAIPLPPQRRSVADSPKVMEQRGGALPTPPRPDTAQPRESVAPAARSSQSQSGSGVGPRQVSRVSPYQAKTPRSLSASSVMPKALPRDGRGGSKREYLYFLLLIALAPLAITTFQSRPSVEEELVATVQEHPEVVEKLKALPEDEDLFSVLPDHRFRDAFLPRDSKLHLLFGLVAAGAFFLLVVAAFPSAKANPWPLLAIGLCTATVGIVLLLFLQGAAKQSQDQIYISLSPARLIVFYLIKFIGFSYRCAEDPSNGFWLSFFGFTAGVGLCEELCKCLPLYFRVKNLSSGSRDPANNWRALCLWGMASGMGFGIAEGIMYAGKTYNGVSPASIYAVRFASCVALHAIWAGSVGITMYNRQAGIDGAEGWLIVLFELVRAMVVPMTLHGLYDTLLKKDLDAVALVVAVASFGWFAFQIESMRRSDPAARRVSKSPVAAGA
jgi:RsiW-degrading membrane proteinase PrsW (M82 family)